MIGTIIVAAHNEESVIGRTLAQLTELVTDSEVKVVVVCNGCTDKTADVARSFPEVHVVELAVASKVAALREGDRLAADGPRIYLDADVVLTGRAAGDVLRALGAGGIVGRPPHVFDTTGGSRLVRRWYLVRSALPSLSRTLWGAGCYALSEEGRSRFDQFPDVISDDLFIHALFMPEEVTIIETDPVVVSAPRRLPDLVRILRRSYRTQPEVLSKSRRFSSTQRAQLHDLAALLRRSPWQVGDIVLYAAVIAYSRLLARIPTNQKWERDSSSRRSS